MSNVQKSFVTMGLTAVLSNVTNSVIEAEKKAKSSREIQTMHILRPGLRQDIFIGSLMVIPYSIMEDIEKVPLPLLRGAVMTLFAGEEAQLLEAHRLAETEFDKLEGKDFAQFKDKLFRDEDGKLGCLCVFLPAWANPRDYAGFRFVKDPEKLSQLIRHLVFAAYFRPSLSAMFDILEENQMQLDVVNIEHDHMGGFADLMGATNTYPVLESGAGEVKTASVARKPLIRFAASEIDSIKKEILSGEEQAVMDQLTDAIVSKAASVEVEAHRMAPSSDKPIHRHSPGGRGPNGHSNEAVPQRADYNDNSVSYTEDPSDPKYVPQRFRKELSPACRKCNNPLEGNKSEYYCDKCNMPLKKYAGLDEAMQSSMMRFGEEPEDEQTIIEAPPMADEGMVDRIAADAEMAVTENYLSEGDALSRVENVDDEAYEQALEIAIYEAMEKNKVPYHEAEAIAEQVKAKILGQYTPTEEIDEVDTDVTPDPELARELDNFYDGSIDSTEFESQPHAFTSSVEKVSMMDFFNKCEKCGALTSVPPGEDPEGHGTICADCSVIPADTKTSDYDPAFPDGLPTPHPLDNGHPEMTEDEFNALQKHHNDKALAWEQEKQKAKVGTPTAWSIDNTREEPSSDPLETSEEQMEEKKKNASKKFAEKAHEYFDVVREEVQEPDGEETADGEELKTPTEVLVAVDVLSEDFQGEKALQSPKKETSEPKEEAPKKENPFEAKKEEPKEEKEESEEEPKQEKEASAKRGGLKNAALGRRSLRSKQAISYFHPGDGLAQFAPEELEGVALHPEFSDQDAPDLKLSSKTSGRKFAFDWMAPGQVLKEFQPDVLNQMLDHSQDKDDYHPVQPDAELQPGDGQEVTRDDYDCDESHSLTSPGLVSTESGGGTPLRSQERNIRGPFFMDQFYKIHADISPANLTIKSSINQKTASDIDGAMVVADFLAKLSAEIASTLLAAFVVTNAPAFVGVPTTGTISLMNVGTDVMMSPLLGAAMNPITQQLKSLLDNMNDSQLTEAINDAWAQSAVWKEAGTTSFLYEVFVRIESVDTEAMTITYKFITDLKEK